MPFYLVFGSIKRPVDFLGGKALDWGQPPIGVYQADTAEQACMAAASDNGQMATYFAVEGTPWGVDLIDVPARQLGRSKSGTDALNDRIGQVLDRMEANDKLIAQLTAEEDDKRTLDDGEEH